MSRNTEYKTHLVAENKKTGELFLVPNPNKEAENGITSKPEKKTLFSYDLLTGKIVTLTPIYAAKVNQKTGVVSTYIKRYDTLTTEIDTNCGDIDFIGISKHAVNSVYLVKRVGRLDKKTAIRKGGNSKTEEEIQFGNVLQGHDKNDIFQAACLAALESYNSYNHTGLTFDQSLEKIYKDARRAVNTLIGGIQRRRVQDANTDGRLRDTYEMQAYRQTQALKTVLDREHVKYVLSRLTADEKRLFVVWYKLYSRRDFLKEPSANDVRRALRLSEEKRKTIYRRIRAMKKRVVTLWRDYNVEGYNGITHEMTYDNFIMTVDGIKKVATRNTDK